MSGEKGPNAPTTIDTGSFETRLRSERLPDMGRLGGGMKGRARSHDAR